MRVFIAEDEAPARERLIQTIAQVAPDAIVAGHAPSVAATRQWLATHPEPDLLLLDIQLADGLSLELFQHGELALPTVFTTAYDEFALAAFQALAIDYLLKPVDEASLGRAFARVRRLRERFAAEGAQTLLSALRGGATPFGSSPAPRHRQRWVARKGAAYVTVPADQVACFVSVDKLCFLITHDGNRHLVDDTLAEVEAGADPDHFFRINRQMLVAASAIERFAPAGKGRLEVQLKAGLPGDATVSQERAAAFREWLRR